MNNMKLRILTCSVEVILVAVVATVLQSTAVAAIGGAILGLVWAHFYLTEPKDDSK